MVITSVNVISIAIHHCSGWKFVQVPGLPELTRVESMGQVDLGLELCRTAGTQIKRRLEQTGTQTLAWNFASDVVDICVCIIVIKTFIQDKNSQVCREMLRFWSAWSYLLSPRATKLPEGYRFLPVCTYVWSCLVIALATISWCCVKVTYYF
jgi:hypothetical protein